MLALASALLFAGYTLVYAAVANGGKFAATPWEALRADAYTGGPPGAAGSPSAGGTTSHGGGAAGAIEGALKTVIGLLP